MLKHSCNFMDDSLLSCILERNREKQIQLISKVTATLDFHCKMGASLTTDRPTFIIQKTMP